MSNIYIQEPATSGKALLTTSFGELEIELWSKEAPVTCRNFIRRCLDKYYDGTIFHRIIPKFIAQGGSRELNTEEIADATSKSADRRLIEVHQRLRFVRRGLVACAATQSDWDDDNPLAASARNEFFITLDACPELQGKHTIFGKLTSQTLYNALKLHDIQLDANNRPLYPPDIKKAVVVDNPFPDLVANSGLDAKAIQTEKYKKESAGTDKKTLPTKNCLSFAGEEADDDGDQYEEPQPKRAKKYLKSAHDFDDPVLSKVQSELNDFETSNRVNDSRGGPATEITATETEPTVKNLTKVEELRSQAEQLKLELAKEKLSVIPRTLALKDKLDKAEDALQEKVAGDDSPYQQRAQNASKYRTLQQAKKDKSAHEQRVLDRLSQFKGKLYSFQNVATPLADDGAERIVSDNTDVVERGNNAGSVEAALFLHKLKCTHDADIDDDDGGLTVIHGKSSGSKVARDASKLRTVEDFDLYDPRNPLNKQRREDSKRKKISRGAA